MSLDFSSRSLAQKSDLHWQRKFFHFFICTILALGMYVLPSFWATAIYVVVGGFFVAFDFLRLYFTPLNHLFTSILRPFLRKQEAERISAATWLILGCFGGVFFLPPGEFSIVLILMGVLDPFASLIGRSMTGLRFSNGKSLMAAFLSAILGFAMLLSINFLMKALFKFSLAGPLFLLPFVMSTAEVLSPKFLDDNFTIPWAATLLLLF